MISKASEIIITCVQEDAIFFQDLDLISRFKGISRGLNGKFLSYLIPILIPLGLFHFMCQWLAIENVTHFYSKNHSGGSVMLLHVLGPWISP